MPGSTNDFIGVGLGIGVEPGGLENMIKRISWGKKSKRNSILYAEIIEQELGSSSYQLL